MKFSKRHIVKSISWRIIGTVDKFIFAWLISGDINQGINISGITTISKLIWYYIHERLWFNSSVTNSNTRHIIKTFSWRFIGTIDTVLFSWLLTGNPLTGLKIGGSETVSKMFIYYLHEKLWHKSNYGLDLPLKIKSNKKSNTDKNKI